MVSEKITVFDMKKWHLLSLFSFIDKIVGVIKGRRFQTEAPL